MPTSFPDNVFVASDTLAPEKGIAYARSEGGMVVTSRRGDPFWRGTITTPALPLDGPGIERMLRPEFITWLHWAEDLNMRIDFTHPRHRLPRSYDDDTWPMGGDGAIVSVTDLRTIVVSGLTMGLILKRGDRLSIVQDDLVVHRWIGASVVVSSTTVQSPTLTPRLPIGIVEAGADVVLEDPVMRFMIVGGSIVGDEAIEPTPVSFEVSEVLV
jgi:hypothetical protein